MRTARGRRQVKNFSCQPKNFCNGKASCCRGTKTRPAVTVGDYLRINRHTNESVKDIWRTKGSMVLSNTERPFELDLSLSLEHDPCPYLNRQSRCDVYEVRPYSCASFPVAAFMHAPEVLPELKAEFACIKRARPSLHQLELGNSVFTLMMQEVEAELSSFWGGLNSHIRTLSGKNQFYELNFRGGRPTIFVDLWDIPKFADEVLEKADIDGQVDSSRIAAAQTARADAERSLIEASNSDDEQVRIHINDYATWMSPLVYLLMADSIETQLNQVYSNYNLIPFYAAMENQWRDLNQKIA